MTFTQELAKLIMQTLLIRGLADETLVVITEEKGKIRIEIRREYW
jgi:hypothetical protein